MMLRRAPCAARVLRSQKGEPRVSFVAKRSMQEDYNLNQVRKLGYYENMTWRQRFMGRLFWISLLALISMLVMCQVRNRELELVANTMPPPQFRESPKRA
ncbi:hypothetical protein DIPPA_10980 [Diplonema papillatum]|nr:hypothetical protein DIPPA_10980 [Diplonema papillatum]